MIEDAVELSDYSSRFLSVLLAEFPLFRQHLAAGAEPGTFKVTFQTPSDSTFWVDTEDEYRITVGFDAWHNHFDVYLGVTEAQSFQRAIDDIREWMNDIRWSVKGRKAQEENSKRWWQLWRR